MIQPRDPDLVERGVGGGDGVVVELRAASTTVPRSRTRRRRRRGRAGSPAGTGCRTSSGRRADPGPCPPRCRRACPRCRWTMLFCSGRRGSCRPRSPMNDRHTVVQVPAAPLQHLHQALLTSRTRSRAGLCACWWRRRSAVSRASDTRVTDGVRVAGRDLLHGGQPGFPGREQVAEDEPFLGQPVHLHRDLGDHAEPALAAQDHLPHARAGGGARQRRG